ncbi:MAG TPA: TA system VapC family ribonuclease toxin [Pirellulales bacterium]|jgi:toxin-antitoxin system PIN domain toxin|nr:TA system VapC family ribonuclease toxin [Pirellulales bacterium]
MLLPDINVWLALTFASHEHHRAAKQWYDSLVGEICFFSRISQQGFLRLATNTTVFGSEALTPAAAWNKYDLMLSDPSIEYRDELAGIEVTWREITQQAAFSVSKWTDAYLAAFAKVAGLEIVTFDKGFARFQDLKCTILSV